MNERRNGLFQYITHCITYIINYYKQKKSKYQPNIIFRIKFVIYTHISICLYYCQLYDKKFSFTFYFFLIT